MSLVISLTVFGVAVIAEIACAAMWIRREIQDVRAAVYKLTWLLTTPPSGRTPKFDLFKTPEEFTAKLEAVRAAS